MSPVPKSLAKLGIGGASDNIDPDQVFCPKQLSRSFSLLFGDELAQAVLRRFECAKRSSLPCPSDR